MYAVGHIALGYLVGRAFNRGKTINIPLIWTLSLLPDIDLLIPSLPHRGPTHSLIVPLIVFVPIFLAYKWKAVPYIAALATHTIVGDMFTKGGVQILWPFSMRWVSHGLAMCMASTLENYVEIALFLVLIFTIALSKDYYQLFNTNMENVILFIPLCTIVLPAMFRFPLVVPNLLILPHVILMGVVLISISMPLFPFMFKLNKIKTKET